MSQQKRILRQWFLSVPQVLAHLKYMISKVFSPLSKAESVKRDNFCSYNTYYEHTQHEIHIHTQLKINTYMYI